MIFIQQLRKNDISPEGGKQFELGKAFFTQLGWEEGNEYPITIHCEGNDIHTTFKVRASERGGTRSGADCKEYSNKDGEFPLKDFLRSKFAAKHVKNICLVFEFISGEGKEFNLYFTPLATKFSDEDLEEGVVLDSSSTLSECINLLRKKYNLVLTGAPGTGKTFLAKQIAAQMVGNCAWNKLSDDQMEHIRFIQFHPSYDYTDFVEGLRPDKDGDFVRTDGDFKDFCKAAVESEKDGDTTPHIFIIDEINRGEISKIFGELFYSIEADYRGDETLVRTQYNNMVTENDTFYKGFYVPENVYIIGTMNDIDRGVEAMDFAIRRRFAWREVTAEESADNMGIQGTARKIMDDLNKALKECKLTEAFFLGGAYFRKVKDNDYDALWKYHLKGIVSEYFRGEPDADDKLALVEKAYKAACKAPEVPAETRKEQSEGNNE